MKKIFKSALVVITILFLLCPMCFADDVKFKDQIKKEDGSLFEKIIDIKRFYAYTCDVLSKDVGKIYLPANYWRYIENDVKQIYNFSNVPSPPRLCKINSKNCQGE